ncbi:MAG: exosortase/archaeosortase family protein [Kiritimatiellia bacterium]|jgi:exosortase
MPSSSRARFFRIAIFIVGALLACLLFQRVFVFMRDTFLDETEDMAHGWYIPLFSLYLLWRQRKELAAAARGAPPSWLGILGAFASLALLWLGERGGQVRFSQLAFILMLWALPCAIWGRRLGRLVAFPAAYMLFTVPLGFLSTVRLRLLVTRVASVLLNGIGISVVRVGSGLVSTTPEGPFNLDVAEACSGLRSLFALMAVTAAYAYLTQTKTWKRWFLFACSVPLAVIGNIMRVFTIAVVARFFGQDFGVGFYHDYSGYVVFIVAIFLMVAVGAWLEKDGKKGADGEEAPDTAQDGEEAPPSVEAAPPRAPFRWAGIVALLAAMATMLVAFRSMPPPVIESQEGVMFPMPERLPTGEEARRPLFCQDEQCGYFEILEAGAVFDGAFRASHPCPECGGPLDTVSPGERRILPDDTLIEKRVYAQGDRSIIVNVVVNGERRTSIHRPEMCIPAQGYSIDRESGITIPRPDGSSFSARTLVIRPESGNSFQLHAYWFESKGFVTDSHLQRILTSVKDRAFRNRITRWSMVTLTCDIPVRADGLPDIARAEAGMARFAAAFDAARKESR